MAAPPALWWLWLVAGLALIGAELLVVPTGLYLLFLGASALLVGLLGFAGLAGEVGLQLLLFVLLSFASLLFFRRALASRLRTSSAPAVGELVGETAVALGPVAANAVGSAEMRGAIWRVRNVGKFDVAEGQRCRIERVEGLELWVRGV
jgi:membrane protein implicated in regulation of membrane protease activity